LLYRSPLGASTGVTLLSPGPTGGSTLSPGPTTRAVISPAIAAGSTLSPDTTPGPSLPAAIPTLQPEDTGPPSQPSPRSSPLFSPGSPLYSLSGSATPTVPALPSFLPVVDVGSRNIPGSSALLGTSAVDHGTEPSLVSASPEPSGALSPLSSSSISDLELGVVHTSSHGVPTGSIALSLDSDSDSSDDDSDLARVRCGACGAVFLLHPCPLPPRKLGAQFLWTCLVQCDPGA
jgi:hypothetical protein